MKGYSRLCEFQLVHDELALQWVVSNGSSKELATNNSWFFFELMVSIVFVPDYDKTTFLHTS